MYRTVLLIFAAAASIIVFSLSVRDDLPAAKPLQETPGTPAAALQSPAMPLADIIELAELAHAHRRAGQFWQRDKRLEAERIEGILRAETNARAALLDRFGSLVSQAPIFWRLFRPLHDRMPHLSVQQQIRIHELERHFVAASLRSEESMSFDEHLSRVREQLGPEIAGEYALHSSPLADELRRITNELSEDGFRQAFTALSQLNETTDSESFVAARRQLREHLGSRQFARLWSLRDPRFDRIETVAKRFDLSAETVLTAYSVLLENQEAMLTAAAASRFTGQQEPIREQHEAGRRRLEQLIGARAADALLLASAGAPNGLVD